MKQPTRDGRFAWYDWLVMILIMGYFSMSRSFAHVGIRPFYIGETAFLLLVLSHGRAIFAPWLGALVQPRPLSSFSWWLYLSLGFGVLETMRGLSGASLLMITLQNAAFHLYPLFFFIGLWVGGRQPAFLATAVRATAWLQAVYGVTFMLFLYQYVVADPVTGTSSSYFGQPYGPAPLILCMLSLELTRGLGAIPLLVNSLLLLGLQVRAAWFSFMVSLPLWGVLSGHLRQVIVTIGLLAGALMLAFVTDVRLPSPGRGGEISARSIIARAVAAVDPALAAEISPDFTVGFAGTISWRQDWWRALWRVVHASHWSAALGMGYGYPIWKDNPYLSPVELIHTPHNVFMYILSYTGWMGVVIFYSMQAALGLLMWRTYRQTGQPLGVCFWLMLLIWSHFDNYLESPFGGIPFYLVIGLCAAQAFPQIPPRPVGGRD
ncbi:MAG: O-antigen ligase family protein [Thermoguttaceae bacterium]